MKKKTRMSNKAWFRRETRKLVMSRWSFILPSSYLCDKTGGEWMNIAMWQAFLSPEWTRLNALIFLEGLLLLITPVVHHRTSWRKSSQFVSTVCPTRCQRCSPTWVMSTTRSMTPVGTTTLPDSCGTTSPGGPGVWAICCPCKFKDAHPLYKGDDFVMWCFPGCLSNTLIWGSIGNSYDSWFDNQDKFNDSVTSKFFIPC